jgi:hypothetical protein
MKSRLSIGLMRVEVELTWAETQSFCATLSQIEARPVDAKRVACPDESPVALSVT